MALDDTKRALVVAGVVVLGIAAVVGAGASLARGQAPFAAV